ncbi:type II toxin-antitoxin system RelE/ParE family toxin [Teredinibacter franksiae]|uniref:type II toxin-antitoxin system RelE/ParE family toxin n=1 Tax=Teredinibacter franksiae TaxID=2761453 RepID=UPI0016244883|nr:type II toxin-antitoxin system RelE/ParE family toxin [Teredinibacter franksiae]
MGTFQLTKLAKSDLKSIAAYTQRKWGKEQRKMYMRQFDEAFQLLADTSELSNACDYIKTGYLKFPVTSHIFFYTILPSSHTNVIRVLHKRVDTKPLLIEA